MKGETMKNPIHQKQTITRHNESLHFSPWRRCILLNSLIFACFALSLTAQAITEPKKVDEKNKYAAAVAGRAAVAQRVARPQIDGDMHS
jgi:hypothetical protein